jgi:hypothetical protein
VSFNMERTNLRRYEEWYQFRDPLRGSLPVFPRRVYPDFTRSFWIEDCLQ